MSTPQQVTPPSSVGGGEVAPAAPSSSSQKKSSTTLENHVLVPEGPDEETEDGIIRNLDAIAKIRDTWIYKQVRLRQDEFTNYRQVRHARCLQKAMAAMAP